MRSVSSRMTRSRCARGGAATSSAASAAAAKAMEWATVEVGGQAGGEPGGVARGFAPHQAQRALVGEAEQAIGAMDGGAVQRQPQMRRLPDQAADWPRGQDHVPILLGKIEQVGFGTRRGRAGGHRMGAGPCAVVQPGPQIAGAVRPVTEQVVDHPFIQRSARQYRRKRGIDARLHRGRNRDGRAGVRVEEQRVDPGRVGPVRQQNAGFRGGRARGLGPVRRAQVMAAPWPAGLGPGGLDDPAVAHDGPIVTAASHRTSSIGANRPNSAASASGSQATEQQRRAQRNRRQPPRQAGQQDRHQRKAERQQKPRRMAADGQDDQNEAGKHADGRQAGQSGDGQQRGRLVGRARRGAGQAEQDQQDGSGETSVRLRESRSSARRCRPGQAAGYRPDRAGGGSAAPNRPAGRSARRRCRAGRPRAATRSAPRTAAAAPAAGWRGRAPHAASIAYPANRPR